VIESFTDLGDLSFLLYAFICEILFEVFMLLLHLLGVFFKVEWSALALALAALASLAVFTLFVLTAAGLLILVSKTALVVLVFIVSGIVAGAFLNAGYVEAEARRTLVKCFQDVNAFSVLPNFAHVRTSVLRL